MGVVASDEATSDAETDEVRPALSLLKQLLSERLPASRVSIVSFTGPT